MDDPDDKIFEDSLDEAEESTESHIVVRDESTALGERVPESDLLTIPEDIPILPLRGVVVYPHTVVPLTIGQPRSIRLVDDVAAKDRLIGLVASLILVFSLIGLLAVQSVKSLLVQALPLCKKEPYRRSYLIKALRPVSLWVESPEPPALLLRLCLTVEQ